MNEQPDKFFQEKLYNYQRPVSPEVWKRIARKRKEGNSIKWLRVAAAIPLLAVAGFLLFPVNTKEPQTAIIGENEVKASNSASQHDDASTADQTLSNETLEQITSATPGPGKKDIPHKNVKKQKITSPQIKPSADQEIIDATDPVPVPSETDEAIDESADNLLRQVASSAPSAQRERKTVTIVFSAEEVNEKFLNKSAVAEATPPAKETSTFRKLLDKAYDLKHNQDPLGELRQKKNEIFALNFSGERQRNEN
jgi:hypothetical protein